MKKIIITDAVDKKCAGIFEENGFEINYNPGMPVDEIKKVIKDYNALVVRSDTQVTADLIDLMDNMEVIGRAGAGVDNINIEAATRKGIIVMNTPGGNTVSTAEHTMALMLSMCRNIPQANQSLREDRWDRKKYKGTELQGKTLGVVGLGKVGREVAKRSKAFDMNVIGYDPVLSEEITNKMGVKLVDLNTVYLKSDILTFHVPLSDETRNMLSEEKLKICKDGVKIINCARGGIVNEDDLLQALNSGKVSGAAFDVYVTEPPVPNSPFIHHPKIVATPHLGASTEEAQEKVAIQIAEQIVSLFKNKGVRGAINASAILSEDNKELAPYVRLAENLGVLHAQLNKGQLKEININFSGELLHSSTTLLSTAVLKGFLSKKLTAGVNLINAPFLAKEMGIVINEIKSGANSNYTNLLTVNFVTDKEDRLLAGTVFGNKEIRIVDIDNYHLELKPEGFMLLYTNIDKPGMLANVGKILADANINIAGLSLGRLDVGKEALTVINVDSEIDKNLLLSISSISGVKNVYSVKL
ncbi:MAG TPA: phosphoglycerate dehydrogenase [Ignavibacteria bacterium]|nr:phosphoglycerate dehydrogenase [Ignavibacteria bacterium]